MTTTLPLAGDPGPFAQARSSLVRLSTNLRREDGAATAEYAIATLAAVGLAGLLVAILRGDEVRGMLTEVIRRALTSGQ